MRADAHYVDSLSTSPRGERARDHARQAGGDDPAPRVLDDRRLLDHVTEGVAAIESAAAMLAADKSPLGRRVGLDLVRAQASRTSWLMRAHALLGAADPDAVVRRRPLGALLADVRERAAVECRLNGFALEVHVTGEAAALQLAEGPVSVGLTGAVMAQLGLAAGSDGGVIQIQATVLRGELASIDVTQDAVPTPASVCARFFDAPWAGRPGGWLAGVGAATARAGAERLGGTAAVLPAGGHGCTIRWSLPLGDAAASDPLRQ
jgi:hypothetical protein